VTGVLVRAVLFAGRHRVSLVTGAVGMVTVLVLILLPLAVHYSAAHNHWAAIGAVAGLGALVFAVIATIVAVVAYTGSTLKPVLTFEKLTCEETFPTLGGGAFAWPVDMILKNNGYIAARFIAVRVTLDGADFYQSNPEWPMSDDLHTAQWDGGVNTIIHRHWDDSPPPLSAFVTPRTDAMTFTATFDVVADRADTITKTHTVAIAPPGPPTIARDDIPVMVTYHPQ
jgi:hypothetical protein